jgi:hypothetical protein
VIVLRVMLCSSFFAHVSIFYLKCICTLQKLHCFHFLFKRFSFLKICENIYPAVNNWYWLNFSCKNASCMRFGFCSIRNEVFYRQTLNVDMLVIQAWWGRNGHWASTADRDETRFPPNRQWWRFICSGWLCGRRGGTQLDTYRHLPRLPTIKHEWRVCIVWRFQY